MNITFDVQIYSMIVSTIKFIILFHLNLLLRTCVVLLCVLIAGVILLKIFCKHCWKFVENHTKLQCVKCNKKRVNEMVSETLNALATKISNVEAESSLLYEKLKDDLADSVAPVNWHFISAVDTIDKDFHNSS